MRTRKERLLSSLSAYGAFHSHPGNVAVHLVFVPAILWSAFVMLDATGPLDRALGLSLPVHFSAATLLWLVCTATYVSLEPLAGAGAAAFYLLLLASAQRFAAGEHAVRVALGVHALSWFAQVVVGHGLLEKRRPALLQSLVPSLVLAPFFVVLEVWFVLGYRPALHAELRSRVHKAVGALRVADAAKQKQRRS